MIESFRPLSWPLFLGLIWKSGADPVFWGTVAGVVLSMGNILFVYLIGKKVYDSQTGFFAALFLALSPTCIFWETSILTDIPASFLGVFAVYLFLQNQHFFSGAVGAIAFFTKFTQLIPMALLGGINFIERLRFKFSREGVKFILGSVLLASPFLVFIFITYGNIFVPFIDGKKIYNQMPFHWHEGIFSCLKILFKAESAVFLFVPVSVYLLFRQEWNKHRFIIVALGIVLFALFGRLPTDIPRFFISGLPYLYLLSADGVCQSFRYIQRKPVVYRRLFIVLLAALIGHQFLRIITMRFPHDQRDPSRQYLAGNAKNITGSIWISNPTPFAQSDVKIGQLMYYPIVNAEKILDLKSKIREADFIFWDSGSLFCVPKGREACLKAKEELIGLIVKNFKTEISFRNETGNIIYGIFKK